MSGFKAPEYEYDYGFDYDAPVAFMATESAPKAKSITPIGGSPTVPESSIRTYFPETWLWQLIEVLLVIKKSISIIKIRTRTITATSMCLNDRCHDLQGNLIHSLNTDVIIVLQHNA